MGQSGLGIVPGDPCDSVGRFHVLDPGRHRLPDPFRGVHHAVGTQGHRLDAAAQGSEPRRQHLWFPARHLSAVRGRHQAADQRGRDPGGVEQGSVPHRADDHADPGLRHLGGDSARSEPGDRRRQRRFAVRAGAHLGGRVRRHPRGLGIELEVRLPRRHAFGGADRGLRNRHGLRAGRRHHGRG